MIDNGIKGFLSSLCPTSICILFARFNTLSQRDLNGLRCRFVHHRIAPSKVLSTVSMDSNASGYLLNHAAFSYYQSKEEANIIDLGLSLKTLQPEAYYSSNHENHEVLVDWQQLHPQLKSTIDLYPRKIKENCDDEAEGIQSKERWAYVKVNMDGVVVGRKICILDHLDYLSLALQLEDMFGNQSIAGLHLFEAESEFSLFYKDKDEQWKTVGDSPWKDFVESVKRLRIVRKNEAHTPFIIQ